MSKDIEADIPEDCVLKEDAEEMAVAASALAINEFLAQLALGYAPSVAFERAIDGGATTALRIPSNLHIEALP